MRNKYKAILFHPEGDFVTDFYRDSVNEVIDELTNMGSRWIFYPLHFVATEKTIKETPDGMEWMRGKRIATISKFFSQTWHNNKEQICESLDCGSIPYIYTN